MLYTCLEYAIILALLDFFQYSSFFSIQEIKHTTALLLIKTIRTIIMHYKPFSLHGFLLRIFYMLIKNRYT